MHLLLSLLFILSLLHATTAQGCSASATLVERPGAWIQDGIEQRIFDMQLTNTGPCSFSGTVSVQVKVPGGSKLGYTWGYNAATQQVMGVPELAPKQSYSGIGFIWAGYDDPAATVTGTFSSCSCAVSSTTGDVTVTTGDVSTTGDVTATTGDVSTTTGDVTVTTGDVSTTTGDVTATTGEVSPTTGDVTVTTGDVSTTTGDVTATTGDVSTTTGDVTVTTGDVSTTTGDASSTTPTDPPTTPPLTPTLPPSSTFDRSLVVLILTCGTTDEADTLEVAKMVLNSMGSPADIVSKKNVGTAALTLNNADGTGKYYAMVSANELSCWSTAQQKQLSDYETAYKVKHVILYTYPYDTNGVKLWKETGDTGVVTYAEEMKKYARSLNTDAQISVFDSWVYPSTISGASLATPAFYIEYSGTNYVAAAFINYADGRRHLEFYFAVGTWAMYATVIGPAWLNWVTNGVFAGARRVVLSCHTDDVFMETGMFDPSIGEESETDIYRITPGDLDQMVSWQNGLNARLPEGSDFHVTFPFNGATVIEKGGYDTDALFLHAKLPAVRQAFYWESHTWAHPILDTYTYDQCHTQWANNNATALVLFDNDLTNPVYNPQAVITPSISGLFNGECLRAMYDLGIRYVCGDNTHVEQLPPNDYWGWYTNVTSNGFAGMFVVPRWATNIGYDNSEPTNVVDLYNYLYSTTLTFDDVMQIEIDDNTRYLMAYRHDPYMFHQANMRTTTINGQTASLLSYWVDKIVDSVMSYSTQPIHSYRHSDQAVQLLERQARDQCGFQGTLRMDPATNSIVGITAVSQNSCTYAISGVRAPEGAGVTFETDGDETTIWIQMTPNTPVELAFTSPISIA